MVESAAGTVTRTESRSVHGRRFSREHDPGPTDAAGPGGCPAVGPDSVTSIMTMMAPRLSVHRLCFSSAILPRPALTRNREHAVQVFPTASLTPDRDRETQ